MAIVDPRLHRSNAVIHDAAPNGGEGDAVEIAPWHATQRHFVAGAAKSMGNMSDMTDWLGNGQACRRNDTHETNSARLQGGRARCGPRFSECFGDKFRWAGGQYYSIHAAPGPVATCHQNSHKT